MYSIDRSVEIADYTNPIKRFLNKFADTKNVENQSHNNRIEFGRMRVETDRGAFISNWDTEEFIKAEHIYEKSFPLVANPFYTPPFWSGSINPSNKVTKIKRKYTSGMDVLAQVGGVMANLTQFFTLGYLFYNYYRRSEEIIKNDILVNENMYTEEYKFTSHFASMYWRNLCCCKRKKFKNSEEQKREENFTACQDILAQAMDIECFIRDSIEMQLLKGLFIKERHRILMPLLAMATARRKMNIKNKSGKPQKNQVGAQNIYDLDEGKLEKMSVEDAVGQLKVGMHKSDYEKMVDQFFLENLPTSSYRQKRTQLDHIPRDPEVDSLRGSIIGESGLMIAKNSPSNRSIQGKRMSAGMNLPPSIHKKKSALQEMIGHAELEVDQPMYGVNVPSGRDKFQGTTFQMKSGQQADMLARKSSYRGTRLHKRKSVAKDDSDQMTDAGSRSNIQTSSVTMKKSAFTAGQKDIEFTPQDRDFSDDDETPQGGNDEGWKEII